MFPGRGRAVAGVLRDHVRPSASTRHLMGGSAHPIKAQRPTPWPSLTPPDSSMSDPRNDKKETPSHDVAFPDRMSPQAPCPPRLRLPAAGPRRIDWPAGAQHKMPPGTIMVTVEAMAPGS
ncbi:hypothetical protein G7046_g8919 [Stylonectria norvegica]|nr:hypothetical protein G7046_g8919 [Stylonectria norvegica]